MRNHSHVKEEGATREDSGDVRFPHLSHIRTAVFRLAGQRRLEISMSDKKSTQAEQPYEPVAFAKKHRISIEDAKAIIAKYGSDRKSSDKEARRVAV